MRRIATWVLMLSLVGAGACEERSDGDDHGDHDDHDHHGDHEHTPPAVIDAGMSEGGFDWKLPSGFPRPVVPADNPMSAEKVELGRYIFYDKRLSENQTFACSNCHQQAFAFADQRAVGLGSTGELHTRGSMSLANVGYSPTLTWANPLQTELERQAQVPIFGDDPIELGMTSITEVEERFRAEAMYRKRFTEAFPDDAEPVTMSNLLGALASFERTLISGNSPYDRYLDGRDEQALSESAKRGMVLVTTNEDHRFECNHCHGGFNFSDHVVWEGLQQDGETPPYHQTGLYDLNGKGEYPEPNTGVHNTSLRPEDMGKFKAPTLRNIALTAPYMHDGSIATLEGVLEHYSRGGRSGNRGKTDPLLRPFELTAQEKADIIAFLESLTDQEFITNPALSDPWPAE
jgi:cytochrome c peroxidase